MEALNYDTTKTDTNVSIQYNPDTYLQPYA